ncbi:flagellar motor switch protein FliM [Periweissella fabalis]|uniref:Flagellar motor switch protein FliM n=1 Tax=Periweissella fabalis TaxID=1070421 RepID=A0A7X6N4Y8_9LACO|nr:flagellar motor switch protein FliM [Periweissella fabalis]NKZ23993.1 flagellar motor switch protein FliM [Periweissella fabalis]
MDQVLSQQEIDQLLNAMNNGDITEESIAEDTNDVKIKTYDFRRPTKLSKEYINTVHLIFEDFAKIATNVLSTQLRTSVRLQLASVEQISYDEFIHSIPRVTLIGILQSAPLNGMQLIEINPQLSMLLVDLLCGGQGISSTGKTLFVDKERFSEIELLLLKDTMERLAETFKQAWAGIVDLDTKLEGLDTNPQLLQTMSPNEPVVLSTIEVDILGIKTFINICIPYVFFESITDKLSFHNWFDNTNSANERASEDLRARMDDVKLGIETELGQAEIKLSEFLAMEVGDVIKLNRRISEPLTTYVQGHEYFKVKPGTSSHGQYAIELLERSQGALQND